MKRIKEPKPIPPGCYGFTDGPIITLPFTLTFPVMCQACGQPVADVREHDCPQMQEWIENNNPDVYEDIPE